jgi:hypothetical protein
MDFNPYLKQGPRSSNAARGSIEKVDAIENLVWQTRPALPTDYENRLADLLEQAFSAGIEGLAPLVAKLNELGSKAPDGAPWSEESFQSFMKGYA